ncbi:hypothetical protein MTR67_042544 [Solanum verrucosum]|uniref:Reverse transcriptase Ty1/copia-type domain-containing protein n=1 Tax=Solanum verrucosum TaxID=315347 RepID=A0AAF0ZU83_SOLVR|nr:hypothetical protein MTR67_042544 [Solanum verrucosum]
MTGNQKLFSDLSKPRSRHEIVTANGHVLTASAIGTIKPFSEVLCAPKLTANLLSVGQLVEQNFLVIFSPNGCVIQNILTGETMARGRKASGQKCWEDAMHEELVALEENDTWDMVDRPTNATIIESRWVYSIKIKADGSLDRYKARLVAQGYKQEYGIDYDETFAPVAKMTTVRILLALASIKGWKLHQLDVKNAFLHGNLQEVVYMNPPPGYKYIKLNQVGRLKKSLYGLKQAPRSWFGKFRTTILGAGFTQSSSDYSLFLRRTTSGITILLLYVDDMIITGNEAEYRSMSAACSEIIWLRRLLSKLGIEMKGSTTLYGDNTSAIRIATNPVHHENTKYIDVDCHYIRELVEDRSISLKYISSKDQLADLFTKAMSRSRHNYLLSKLMFCDTQH